MPLKSLVHFSLQEEPTGRTEVSAKLVAKIATSIQANELPLRVELSHAQGDTMLKLVDLLVVLGLVATPSMASHPSKIDFGINAVLPVNQPPQEDWPPYLITLTHAQTLDDRLLGYAATPSPLYQAFEQAQTAGSDIHPLLQAAFSEATSAGKIYIARLIQQVNPIEGRQLWQKLRSDPSAIETRSGCLIFKTTVSEVAAKWLQKK